MTTPRIEEMVEKLYKKDFVVFGEAGMGIDKKKLTLHFHQALTEARQEERERLYKEFEEVTDGWKSPVPMETAKGILTNWSEYKVVYHSELDQDKK